MKCRKCDSNSIELSSKLLKEGKVLILPTDTVYGFSSIVGQGEDLIRKIKGRDEKKSFIILIDSPEKVSLFTDEKIPEKLLKYWPGPLTIIVNSRQEGKTVALRVPGDEWIRKVIASCGSPIYSTSVNKSGSPVLTKEEEILSVFEKDVALTVLNGDSKTSTPSTIVKVSKDEISLIRKGSLDLDCI